MGYTKGRRLTDELLREIASKYKTRSDFQKADSSAYCSARRKGHDFLDSICNHMISGSYSKPQLYCKVITEKLLGEKCMYNTKSIIKPYEIDVYYPSFKLAFEYNGKGWHFKDDVVERDEIKRKKCEESDITLIVLSETNREYEEDVKNQIVKNLDIINRVTGKLITSYDVFSVDCSDVYNHVLKIKNLENIDDKINDCESIVEFMGKYKSEYNVLMKNDKLSLLDSIRNRIEYTDEELIEKCLRISDYSDFLKNHSKLYHRCHKRGLLEIATSHMTRKRRIYKHRTDEDLLNMASNFGMKADLRKADISLHYELSKRKLFDKVIFNAEFVYKTDAMLRKEEKINNCFNRAKQYDNYDDFKNDISLYNTCKKYKIINQVTSHFKPIDVESLIIEKSKEYNSFLEFTRTEWYQKSKKFKGLTNKLKKLNKWNFSSRGLINFVERYPEVVKLINNGMGITEIYKQSNVKKTTVWRVKKQMESQGILKVPFKHKKPKSLAI